MYDLTRQLHIKTIGDLIDALNEYDYLRDRPISINGIEEDQWGINGLYLNVDMIDDNTDCVDCLTLDQYKRTE